MVFNKTAVVILTGLAGLAAMFVGKQRQNRRAEALKDRVDIQDWESAPLKGTVPAANPPAPKDVAKEVTGVQVG